MMGKGSQSPGERRGEGIKLCPRGGGGGAVSVGGVAEGDQSLWQG